MFVIRYYFDGKKDIVPYCFETEETAIGFLYDLMLKAKQDRITDSYYAPDELSIQPVKGRYEELNEKEDHITGYNLISTHDVSSGQAIDYGTIEYLPIHR